MCVRISLFCNILLSCADTGLAMVWQPSPGVLSSVYIYAIFYINLNRHRPKGKENQYFIAVDCSTAQTGVA